eukprot:4051305-Pyramimonas_sp.AAC.1
MAAKACSAFKVSRVASNIRIRTAKAIFSFVRTLLLIDAGALTARAAAEANLSAAAFPTVKYKGVLPWRTSRASWWE